MNYGHRVYLKPTIKSITIVKRASQPSVYEMSLSASAFCPFRYSITGLAITSAPVTAADRMKRSKKAITPAMPGFSPKIRSALNITDATPETYASTPSACKRERVTNCELFIFVY